MKIDGQNLISNIYNNINYWISHAEAKNVTLLGFNVAVIVALLQIDTCYWLVILFIISAIPSLVSFVPRIKPIFKKQKGIINTDNLLFFKDISKYNPQEYFDKLINKYKLKMNNKLLFDYCEEIVANAKIAVWKYSLFGIGLGISIFSTFVMLLYIVSVLF